MTSDIENNVLSRLSKSFVALELDDVLELVKEALEMRVQPQSVIKDGLIKGLDVIGSSFSRGESFLSEIIFAGYIMKEAMVIVEPHLKTGDMVSEGKIVVAVVEGDLHDIGKNMAATLFRSAGFEVIDLGVDVPAERIVKVTEEEEADIVALSALLSVVQPYVERTIESLRQSKIGDKVKILLGGRAIEAGMDDRVSADAYAHDAWDGIGKAKALMRAS
jgi:methylmalonyl-CoA mutase cobalamin-binding domain/chain